MAKQATAIKLGSRGWVAPVMLAFFLIGLAWIVLFYVTEGDLPLKSFGNWNIVVGFGFIARRLRCLHAVEVARPQPPRQALPTGYPQRYPHWGKGQTICG